VPLVASTVSSSVTPSGPVTFDAALRNAAAI
jgi:hypothetical protein